ncbi:hypothetical protein HrrHc1_160 [Halorubrum phage Hardycor1]|nr:hypothetical protein HrrHc1_160 [Halorubrum phage Hardycor1]
MSAKTTGTHDARTETETEFADALTAATEVATYDPAAVTDVLMPESTYDMGTLGGTLAFAFSPSSYVLRNAVREPDADEVDGAKPGDAAPRTARSFVFDLDRDDEADEGDLVFRAVERFENSYGDTRIVLDTPAPWDTPDDVTGANEVIKSLPWGDEDAEEHDDLDEGVHYAFDDDDRHAPASASDAWTIDKHGAAALREAAIDAGYEWVVEWSDEADDEDERDTLDDLLAFAAEGDEVVVRYHKKNGNGIGTKSGVVTVSDDGTGEDRYGRSPTAGMVLRRDDGRTNRVRRDDDTNPAVFSSGRYPFMGELASVEVVPADE